VRWLNRKEVDIAAWDQCIADASNGLIYAYSFYLDTMTDHWSAVVLNDYEAVMPLPWRRKGGIAYIYQPYLTAQLGVFGKAVNAEMIQAFLDAVPRKYKYWDMMLNHQNLASLPAYPMYQRTNFVLALHKPYESLYRSYRENSRRNIKKSHEYGCRVSCDVEIEAVLELTRFQPKQPPEKDKDNFRKLYALLKEKGMAKTYGVRSQTGELLASCVLFLSHNRAYYILVGNHPNGRTLGASHAVIDAFIRDHAGQEMVLDFEGSDVRNLAFFYSSFGATEEKYAAMKVNRLPWWLRWVK
jgi:hypothetical protein